MTNITTAIGPSIGPTILQLTNAPGAPINGAATGFFDPPSRVELTWADNPASASAAVDYIVVRDGQPDVTINAPVTNFSDTRDLDPDTAYTYRLQAVNDDGLSAFSAPINVAIPNLVLAGAPGGLTQGVQWISGELIEIAWSASVAGSFPIASYNVYRDDILSGNTGIAVLDLAIAAILGVEYAWKVSAVDTDGNEGDLSAELVATFLPQQPVNHWDETGIVGAAPITAWNDSVGAEAITVLAGVINTGLQNGLATVESQGPDARMISTNTITVLDDITLIVVGELKENMTAGLEFLVDGRGGANARMFWINRDTNDKLIGLAGEPLIFDLPVANGPAIGISINNDTTQINNGYFNNVVQRSVGTANRNYQGIRIFSDSSGGRQAPAGSWIGEIMFFDVAIDADERQYWTDTLRAKWGL